MHGQTGFSDVDASGRSAALVDYLGDLAPHVGEVRRDGYEMLALRPGDSVLDVGCGAGEVCVELSGMVGPQGRVAGVDLSESMIAAARRTVAAGGRAIELRVASVYELPFEDGVFDGVRAERVFQHLDDPEAALREMIRVARPGGRILVADPDHSQAGLAIDDPAHRNVYDAIQRAMARMIVNPSSGTRLRGMFVRAGLVGTTQRVRSVDFSNADFMRTFFVDDRLAAAAKAGDITLQDGRDFVAAMEARRRAGTFFANAIAYSVVGTKQ
jgi:SAM-dependent methyltransferase